MIFLQKNEKFEAENEGFKAENERFRAEIERMKHEQLARAEQVRGHHVFPYLKYLAIVI